MATWRRQLGWTAALLLSLTACKRSPPPPPPAPAAEPSLPIKWTVPSFSFVDQDGHRFSEQDLRGRTWIADFIFTQCTSVCPMLTAQMKLVQRAVRGHEVSFVSFSVDPVHDTPAALKAYAARWRADESRWRLLNTGDQATLQRFVAGMHTDVAQTDDSANPIMHSDRFVLIDAQGRVRDVYDSTSADDLKRLETDATKLADSTHPGTTPVEAPVTASAATGRELAMSLGCFGCHTSGGTAPPFDGLFGSQAQLDSGATVKVDEAYLRESILDPMAKVVLGYAPIMPSYRGHLDEGQVAALVAYLVSLPRTSQPESARVKAVDPVCHMAVSGGDKTPKATYQGSTYYFCSDECRELFEKTPARYAARADQKKE